MLPGLRSTDFTDICKQILISEDGVCSKLNQQPGVRGRETQAGMRRPCICMKQLSEPGGSHFLCVLLPFLIGKTKDAGYMRSKVSTGFELAADFGSQGVFGGNMKQEAELEKGPFLIQAGRSWGGWAIGQGGMSDPEWRTRARGGPHRHLWLLSVWCPLVSFPLEGHSLPSLGLDGSRKVDFNSSVSATSTVIKAWPILLVCSGTSARILGKMAHLLR